ISWVDGKLMDSMILGVTKVLKWCTRMVIPLVWPTMLENSVAKERMVLSPSLPIEVRDNGLGVINECLTTGEDGNLGTKNRKVCDVSQFQGDVGTEMLHGDDIPVCLLNRQNFSSASSFFLVDHSYKRRWKQNYLVDDENGLFRDKEPPDKGFSSDQESSKKWVDMIEDSGDDEAQRLALVSHVVEESSYSSTGCSPSENTDLPSL
ncbi:unnamed protein product, partial [Ilex paraguariensis]